MTSRVDKFIQSLDTKTRERLRVKLIELKKSPLSVKNVKPLQGWGKNVYRLRMGRIRIIFQILADGSGEVEIMDIDYRGNIY